MDECKPLAAGAGYGVPGGVHGAGGRDSGECRGVPGGAGGCQGPSRGAIVGSAGVFLGVRAAVRARAASSLAA